MKRMSIQQVFNKVCKHLVKQNARCVSKTGGCLYRNDKGMKCALGVLIPDKKYKKSFEEMTSVDLYFKLQNFAFGANCIMDTLQRLHDRNRPSRWKQKLRVVAKNYDLNEPACIKK